MPLGSRFGPQSVDFDEGGALGHGGLHDLWREAADVTEWNLEVVAAFMRAAYGKGYCDALTEDSPGALCQEHGYEIPHRRDSVTQSERA